MIIDPNPKYEQVLKRFDDTCAELRKALENKEVYNSNWAGYTTLLKRIDAIKEEIVELNTAIRILT